MMRDYPGLGPNWTPQQSDTFLLGAGVQLPDGTNIRVSSIIQLNKSRAQAYKDYKSVIIRDHLDSRFEHHINVCLFHMYC